MSRQAAREEKLAHDGWLEEAEEWEKELEAWRENLSRKRGGRRR